MYYPNDYTKGNGPSLVLSYSHHEDLTYNWYQTVNSNYNMYSVPGDYFIIDSDKTDSFYPFYNSSRSHGVGYTVSIDMHDTPGRAGILPNGMYWKGQTSLVKTERVNGKKSFRVMATAHWGFEIKNNKFLLYPIKWGDPTETHLQLLNNTLD